jgi:hypothetical protein
MRLLDRVDGYALAKGRRVTVPLLRQMLNETPEPGAEVDAEVDVE